jgi:hypothetical protein
MTSNGNASGNRNNKFWEELIACWSIYTKSEGMLHNWRKYKLILHNFPQYVLATRLIGRTSYVTATVATFNKKFWEEVIAYFPLIRYGPQRKPKN